MREASDGDAGGEERVAAEQGLSDDHLDPDERAAYTGRVERGLRCRVLHRVEARCDGVGHEVIVEVSVAEHALHDVSQRALRVRAGPRRRQGVRVPGRRAHELVVPRSEEHTSELQSRLHLVCRLLLEKKKKNRTKNMNSKNEDRETDEY